jgi:hypothetical protein
MREPSVFSGETRVTTSRNLDRFPPIRDVMRSVAGAGDFTLLCSDLGDHISASTESSYRIVVLFEQLLRAPENVIAAVAVHEAVHLRMGSVLPARLAERHGDVTSLMHGVECLIGSTAGSALRSRTTTSTAKDGVFSMKRGSDRSTSSLKKRRGLSMPISK